MKKNITKRTAVCFVSLLILLATPFWGHAESSAIKPGKYVTEGGWGDLSIIVKDGKLSFAITSIGSNAHTCSLDGIIKDGRSTMESFDEGKPCIVTFQPRGHDIEVTDNEGACRYYCGVRAGFTGLYLKPKAGCEGVAIQKSRRKFKQLYDKKAYPQAKAVLEPILKDCSRYIHWLDAAWIRNDFAITQYKLGDYEGCLQTLKTLEEDALKTDDQLRDSYPPADAESVIPIARATRTNLSLCRKKSEKKTIKDY